MALGSGFVFPAAAVGVGSLLIRPKQRGFFPQPDPISGISADFLVPDATIEEVHRDRLEITQHPVEYGAAITDHAFKHPVEIVIRCAWSNSSNSAQSPAGPLIGAAVASQVRGAAAQAVQIAGVIAASQSSLNSSGADQIDSIYSQMQALQDSRTLITIYTGKRRYTDMLIEQMTVVTDRATENALMMVVQCRQIILVNTYINTVPLNPAALANPAANTPTQAAGVTSLVPSPSATLPPSAAVSPIAAP